MEQQITIDGVKINYRTGGSGTPMILMHGWGCEGASLGLFERIAMEQHTVYNLDLPGFGKSDEPPTPWGVEEYTRMLEDFCRELDITAPILLGHSFGGRIAILYASRNNVNRLVLVDSAGVKPRRSLMYYLKVYMFKAAKQLYPLIVGRDRAEELISSMRSRNGSADYNNCSPMMRKVLVKAVNTDLRGEMKKIKAPTMLLWGEQDTATPMRDARIMMKHIPHAGLVSFPGAGHFCFIDNPYQAGAVVRRFVMSKPDADAAHQD